VELGARHARGGLRAAVVSVAPDKVVALVLDGEAIPPEQAAFLPLERGLLYGDGLFESMLVIEDCVPDVERHFARMATSANALGFPEPSYAAWDVGIAAALDAVRDRPLDRKRSLRITWTRGATRVRSFAPQPEDGAPRLLVALYEGLPADANSMAPRAAAIIPGMAPGDLGRHKTLSAMAYVVAQERARALGADEALLVDAQGSILEAAGSNVFARFEREGLCTPPLTLPILPGIARERVFGWVRGVRELRLTAEDLYRADEVFLTNAVRGVVPIRSIDGRQVGMGGVGSLTVDVAAEFMVHWFKETRTRRARKQILRPDGSP